MTDVDLLNALRDCYHPVLNRNVVDLKLVRAVELVPDADAPGAGIAGVPQRFVARVRMTAPGKDEGANAQLVAQVENRLLGMEAISRAEIELLPPLFAIL
jgi:metal-sulfur cluster biosynthetic enzyme